MLLVLKMLLLHTFVSISFRTVSAGGFKLCIWLLVLYLLSYLGSVGVVVVVVVVVIVVVVSIDGVFNLLATCT